MKPFGKGSTFLHGSCTAGAALKERGMSMWAPLMTQLVHTHRACVQIPCVSCVLVIVSMADLRPNSFEPQHGLDERVDEAADSDEDGGGDDASCYDDSEERVGNTA